MIVYQLLANTACLPCCYASINSISHTNHMHIHAAHHEPMTANIQVVFLADESSMPVVAAVHVPDMSLERTICLVQHPRSGCRHLRRPAPGRFLAGSKTRCRLSHWCHHPPVLVPNRTTW